MIVVASVVAFILLFVIVPAVVQRAMRPVLQRRITNVYPADQIVHQDLRALSLGLQSKGAWQSRGNGALVLTANELHWFQFTPKIEVRIPRASIADVKTVRSHLGKSIVRDLLHVSFTVGDKTDAIAWHVMDLASWLAKLAPQDERAIRS